MRWALAVLILGFLVAPGFAQTPIQGELDEVEGIVVLRLWGTPYEMGYAQGYLTGDKIKAEFDNYVLPLILHQAPIYNLATDVFEAIYTVPERYAQEAQGIIDGARAAGYDLYIPLLGRELDVIDLNTSGAMPDIIGLFACSSLVAWGEATQDDPELSGDLALVRNLDWIALAQDPTMLARETLVIAREPTDRRPTISVAFPGLIGCLSCMNDAGVSMLQHQSHPGIPLMELTFPEPCVPINIAMREGLELFDPDEDGVATGQDAALVVESMPRSSSYNIVTAGPDPDADPPFSLEANGEATARRYDDEDPNFPPGTLAVTNHMRDLKEPKFCWRYSMMRKNANLWAQAITLDRLWQNNGEVRLGSLDMRIINSLTVQTMIFIPAQRRIGLAYSDPSRMSPDKPPAWMDWEDFFPPDPEDDDDPDDDSQDPGLDENNGTMDGDEGLNNGTDCRCG